MQIWHEICRQTKILTVPYVTKKKKKKKKIMPNFVYYFSRIIKFNFTPISQFTNLCDCDWWIFFANMDSPLLSTTHDLYN